MNKQPVIWDPLIRIFHWSLSTAFLLNYWVLEEGDDLHEWVGYYVLAALALRLVWGFIGPDNARFRSFFPTPSKVRHHISAMLAGKEPLYEGHNPLGGAMIICLIVMMALTGISGWMMTTDALWGEEWVEEVHEIFANVSMLLVAVHIPVVVWFSKFGERNLIRQMITGRKADNIKKAFN
ncbi:cytochrome b/b6 domain-containing protein [Neptunomonas antarctica]|uniref:Cytochrome b n=1 Tax=Neptunomonas antarctica TaxID=619304 RepID=A0A1N7MFW3_9GAMM|nr:cytochrome b/b6 domain-containing protein [Neptunomonas antarctica]SIS84993.1 Cytochrome b [Neptunomonas antarctica]